MVLQPAPSLSLVLLVYQAPAPRPYLLLLPGDKSRFMCGSDSYHSFYLRHSLFPRSKLSINELSVSFYICQCLPNLFKEMMLLLCLRVCFKDIYQAAFLQESLVSDKKEKLSPTPDKMSILLNNGEGKRRIHL